MVSVSSDQQLVRRSLTRPPVLHRSVLGSRALTDFRLPRHLTSVTSPTSEAPSSVLCPCIFALADFRPPRLRPPSLGRLPTSEAPTSVTWPISGLRPFPTSGTSASINNQQSQINNPEARGHRGKRDIGQPVLKAQAAGIRTDQTADQRPEHRYRGR